MTGIDQTEFDQLFKDWYDPIRNFIYYKSGNSQVAEDIAQDTFLKVWEKRNNIKMLTAKNLLYKIAMNIYLNRLEHQNVTFKFINSAPTDGTFEAADYELEMKEFDQRLQKALAGLDEKKRTVFLMNRIDEFTYAQIADILQISVKAVEKRMEKALSYLREKIDVNI
jgi:RNA polymerase sigma-70 factor (family 1)